MVFEPGHLRVAMNGEHDQLVHISAPAHDAEIAADALWSLGAIAVEHRSDGPTDTVTVIAGFPGAEATRSAVGQLRRRFAVTVVEVGDPAGWRDHWQRHVAAVEVAGFTMGPSSLVGPAGPRRIPIDAGRSFGSGAHVTTQLAVEMLVRITDDGHAIGRVLDVGAGSGVLGIIAAHLGSTSVMMVDLDPDAVSAARANVMGAGVHNRCTVALRGPVAEDGPADTVLANLLLADHEAVADAVGVCLAPHGIAVMSGVLAEQLAALERLHPSWTLVERIEREGWVAAAFSRR
ncbi:MAG: 50S ribosomal protein L11 methyltransferase [Acidimicrobiales bacterium]|nr:50S ribosomal protein L11 methyltransferase [Acidimicrobiales bacterium]